MTWSLSSPSLQLRSLAATLVPFVLTAVLASAQDPATKQAEATCGAVVEHNGIRVLHTWGTPSQRGFAHGLLLGNDVALAMKDEFAARFSKQPNLLRFARSALARMIAYPEPVAQELEGLYAGLVQSGADRSMPSLQRDFDFEDVKVANALDVFGLMGCSGFTVHGDCVEGGGVLTGRNFDWPYTGRHLIDATIVLVQHGEGGKAVASVTWPGYVGAVTGINQDGVAAFLHVGSGKVTMTPQPESWPTAIASRAILEEARGDDAKATFAAAVQKLEYTSPPAGFLTRIVMPKAAASESPSGLFETDSRKPVRALRGDLCVVTNHFQGRKDGEKASADSQQRHEQVTTSLHGCLSGGDHKVSVAEGWQALRLVQRGSRSFGTLHSLVFRNEPWVFELRLATVGDDGKLVAAPDSMRAVALTREQLFERPVAGAGAAR